MTAPQVCVFVTLCHLKTLKPKLDPNPNPNLNPKHLNPDVTNPNPDSNLNPNPNNCGYESN